MSHRFLHNRFRSRMTIGRKVRDGRGCLAVASASIRQTQAVRLHGSWPYAIVLLAASLGPSLGAQDINTISTWDGTSLVATWGGGVTNTATYGQTITPTGKHTMLKSFTFYLRQTTVGTAPQYQAYVYRWDAGSSRITGPALFTSAVATAPSGTAFVPVTINVGKIGLASGQQYVLFLTTSSVGQSNNTPYVWGAVANASYAGGQFVFQNNGATFGTLSTTAWEHLNHDLAFQALFIRNLPLMDGSMSLVTLNALHDVNREVQARLDDARDLVAGDRVEGDQYFWVKPYGSWASQGSSEGTPGYSADSYGLVLGADRDFGKADRAGLALSLGHIDVDSKDSEMPGQATIKTYQLIGYGAHSLDSRTEVTWQADFGLAANQGDRTVNVGGLGQATATTHYTSDLFHVGLGLRRQYALGERTLFASALKADYGYIHSPHYTESAGGDLAALSVHGKTAEELIFSLEGKLFQKFNERCTLTVNAGIGCDILNQPGRFKVSSASGGPSYVAQGIQPDPLLAKLGVGLGYHASKGVQFTTAYDLEARESYTNQTASLTLRIPF